MWHQQLSETRHYHVEFRLRLKGIFIFVCKQLGEAVLIVHVIRYDQQPFVSCGCEIITGQTIMLL